MTLRKVVSRLRVSLLMNFSLISEFCDKKQGNVSDQNEKRKEKKEQEKKKKEINHVGAGLADLPLGVGGLGERNTNWVVLSHEAAGSHKLVSHGLVGVVLVDCHGPELLVHRVQVVVLFLGGAQSISHIVDGTVNSELDVSGWKKENVIQEKKKNKKEFSSK